MSARLVSTPSATATSSSTSSLTHSEEVGACHRHAVDHDARLEAGLLGTRRWSMSASSGDYYTSEFAPTRCQEP